MAYTRTIGVVDYVVMCAVLLVSASVGVIFSRTGGRQKTTREYLLANRDMGFLPVALSIIVSYISGIMILGYTTEIYQHGIQIVVFNLFNILAYVISAFTFVPFIRKLQITSSFEYLERRYQSKTVRRLGSLLGILSATLYFGTATNATATAVEAVTDLPTWASIVIVSTVCIFYTTLGGIKAVLWTDVFQFVVMVTAMLAILIKGYITIGGMSPAWDAMAAGDRLNFFVFDPSPATRHSFWTMLIGTTFLSIGFSCFNQASVQRIGSVKTDKDAVKAVLMNAPFLLVLTVPAALCGIAVYTHYTLLRCDPLKMKYVKNENELLAYYVMDVLQDLPGIPGLFIAALMSGALSSNSSSLNGIAAILWEDFLKYRYGKISDWKATLIAKITVIVFGGIGTLVAFMVTLIGGTIFQIALGFDGATNGPLFGLFFLGILCPFANWQGALTGGATSVAILLWLNIGSQLTSSTSYNPILPSVPSDRCEINATVNETWTYDVTTVWNTQSNVTTLGAVMSGTGSQSYSGLNGFYATSYLYYSPLGILITVLVGAAVSAIINRYTRRQPYFDKNLVLRPLRRFVPSKTKYAYELEATPPTEESCQAALTDS